MEKEMDLIGRHSDPITEIKLNDPNINIVKQSRMCSICKPILKSVRIAHEESVCPIGNSRYCSNCAQYGHLTKSCPAKPSRYFTEPAFVEQLIAPSDLKEFKIITRTPLPVLGREEPPQLLEINDNDKAISAYLSARSIKGKGSNKRRILEEYAASINKRVVYLK
jgi:hypothetical protein